MQRIHHVHLEVGDLEGDIESLIC